MDFIDPILSIASQIYTLVENVQANKKRCRRVSDRVRALEELVKSIEKRKTVETSGNVTKALKELYHTLEAAQKLVKKYTLATWVKRILKSSSHEDEFNIVNERLNNAFQVLSGALQLEQGNVLCKVFALASREEEDKMDGKEDDAELGKLLLEHIKDQEEKTKAMQRTFDELKTSVEMVIEKLNKPSITSEGIRMIKLEELKNRRPFMKTPTSEVFKGQYHGFTVAIKRYTGLVNTSPREVRNIFTKEVETMKRFESPNILRMFGICIQDEDGPSPEFLIIMEYCEKGSLRQVLDSDCKLSWLKKACMCLDAAQGLYRSVIWLLDKFICVRNDRNMGRREEKPRYTGVIKKVKCHFECDIL
uniref:mixed lineage kinase domain-like protein n=1 Tax=Monopterus albus TaxID=43700 RepID=UPI0009B405AA|nr:mixed lineage kinase domain-like protein [Monopterus albus]